MRRAIGILLTAASFAVANGTVAVSAARGSTDATEASDPAGTLIALDAATGQEVWRAPTPPIFTIEDVSDRVVAGRGSGCTSGPAHTYAARTRDGSKLWQARIGSASPPIRGGDASATGSGHSGVIVAATAKTVRGLDAATGRERWSVPVEHAPNVSVDARTVLIAEPSNELRGKVEGVVRAVDRATGRRLWSVSVPDADMVTTALGRGGAAVAFVRQTVSGLDPSFPADMRVLTPRTGTERWTADDLAPVAVTESVVVTQQGERGYATGLVVLDAATGTRRWDRSSAPRVWPMGTRLGLHEVVPVRPSDATDRFTVVDAATGNEVWARSLDQPERPIAASDAVVAISDPSTVTLLDAASGATRWQSAPLPEGTVVNSAALTADRVYVAVGCSYSD
jgi:outer membrane protein assembly factor BamB